MGFELWYDKQVIYITPAFEVQNAPENWFYEYIMGCMN